MTGVTCWRLESGIRVQVYRRTMTELAQGGCACCGTATGADALPGGSRPDLVCTLDGGPDAMRERVDEWRALIDRATGRETADGGVTLIYDHDPEVTVELARLAVADFACCSFFTFALTVAPDGMRFTVTAPAQARDVVTAMFGSRAKAEAR
jgi:hypothetical protein